MDTELIQVPPEGLLADNAIRFGLKSSRVESLMADILDKGGVHTPLEVEPYDGELPEDFPKYKGQVYRITDGEYRKTAVERLNKEQGAGLTLPCIVFSTETPLQRIKRQLSHNFERENMSPMDTAKSIKTLFDLGVTRIEIRSLFSRPSSKKGGKAQPASNAWINIMMDFLLFSKAVQTKIHNGEISVEGAYMLSKVLKRDPTRLNAVLEELDADRRKALQAEEKEEEKYLADIKAEEDRKAKLEATEKATEDSKKKLLETSQAYEEAVKAEVAAQNAEIESRKLADKEAKTAAAQAVKDAHAKSVELLKQTEDAKKEADKLAKKMEDAQAKIEASKKKLEEQRKAQAKEPKAKPVGKTEVQKAAKKVESDAAGHVSLKLPEIKEFVHTGTLPGSYPKVQLIFKAIEECISGVTTDNECFKAIAKVTGEYKGKEKK